MRIPNPVQAKFHKVMVHYRLGWVVGRVYPDFGGEWLINSKLQLCSLWEREGQKGDSEAKLFDSADSALVIARDLAAKYPNEKYFVREYWLETHSKYELPLVESYDKTFI